MIGRCGLRIDDFSNVCCGVSPAVGILRRLRSLRSPWDVVGTVAFATMRASQSLSIHGGDQYHFGMISSRAASLKENASLT